MLPKTLHDIYREQVEIEEMARESGDEDLVKKARHKQFGAVKAFVEDETVTVNVSGERSFSYEVGR